MKLKDCFYPTERLDFGLDDKYQPTAYGGRTLDLESRNLVKRRLIDFNKERVDFILDYFNERGCLTKAINDRWNKVIIEIEVPTDITPSYIYKLVVSIIVDCSTGSVKPRPVAIAINRRSVAIGSASDAFFDNFLDNLLRLIPLVQSLDYYDSVIVENIDGVDCPYYIRDEIFLDFAIYTEYSYENKNFRHVLYKKDVCNHTLCEDDYNRVQIETLLQLAFASDVMKSAILDNYSDFAGYLADNLFKLRNLESESR